VSATDYRGLSIGYEFPRSTFRIDSRKIESYRKAVQEPENAALGPDGVPPMAVAAAALGSLAERVSFPFGSIHLTQELDFKTPVRCEELLICHGKLLARKDLRDIHLLTIGVDVYNQREQLVLVGKTGFVLPRTGPPGKPTGADHRRGDSS
jgi:hypothetical protein